MPGCRTLQEDVAGSGVSAEPPRRHPFHHPPLVDKSSPCLQRFVEGSEGWIQLPEKSGALESLSLPED